MNLPESARLLIVEDDPSLSSSMLDALTASGCNCHIATTGAHALELYQQEEFQIVVLDLALQDDSGLGVLRCMRDIDDHAKIVLLTPLDFRQERLSGIEAGADDFVLKPFTVDEVSARVEAALVRARSPLKSTLEVGSLKMDLSARRVVRGNRTVSLTPTEFRILEILLRNHGRVVTRRMLCEFLWDPDWEGVTNVIEVHINRLRSKVTRDDEEKLIHTVRGSGYVLRMGGVPAAKLTDVRPAGQKAAATGTIGDN